jgi:hypothetical protein
MHDDDRLRNALGPRSHQGHQGVGETSTLRIADVFLDDHVFRGALERRLHRSPLLGRQLSLEMQRPAILVPSHPQVPKLRVELSLLPLDALATPALGPELRGRHRRSSPRPQLVFGGSHESGQRLQLIEVELRATKCCVDSRQLPNCVGDTDQFAGRCP